MLKKMMTVAVAATLAILLKANTSQAAQIPITAEYFPDATFAKYVEEEFDKNHDKQLSDDEREDVEEIWVNECGINTLKGIEHFPNLKDIFAHGNNLVQLDISQNKKLEEFSGGENKLTTLSVENNPELTDLYCYDNQLTKLDVSKNKKLKFLYCSDNPIKELSVKTNKKLVSLECSNNQLTKLDVSKNKMLEVLHCENNELKSLNLKNNNYLDVLVCENNKLKSLNLNKNKYLRILDCGKNELTKLDVRVNTSLVELSCSNNKLTKLDVRANKKLKLLQCSYNRLKQLSLKRNKKLVSLKCQYNAIISGSCGIKRPKGDWEYKKSTFSPQTATIKVKKIGKKYYIPIKGLSKTKGVKKLSAGKITSKGILLKGKKIPKQITYRYNMFTNGKKLTKVTINVKK